MTKTATTPVGSDAGQDARAGKHLTFCLAEEVYGLEILKVQEIIGMMRVTRVPQMPDAIRGVINLRGKVIPVIDLRIRFKADKKEDTELTCIIVVQVESEDSRIVMGVIVDEVREVVDLAQERIEDTPSFGEGVDTRFLKGMATAEDHVVLLLDIDRVLSADEFALMDQAATGA